LATENIVSYLNNKITRGEMTLTLANIHVI